MFDFLLLLGVSILLRRNVKLYRIILGSLSGSLTILILFLNINNIQLLIIKFITSILMTIIAFKYKDLKYTVKNLSYLYMLSIILGGFLYFLNIQYSYNHEGLIFYHNGLSINLITLLIISPIIIKTYIKQLKSLKSNYSNYYKVDIKYKEKIIKLNAFLDTGNKLIDPVTKVPVIIVKEKYFKNIKEFSFIPYNTISENGILKCIKPQEIKINNKTIHKKVKIGLVKNIKMEGIECILNQKIMEEI